MRIKLLIILLTVGITTATAQQPANVTQGGYSPMFQQAADAPAAAVCPTLKGSEPACGTYDPTTVYKRFRFRNANCKMFEVVATDSFTGKACQLGFECDCGKDT